MSKEETVRKLNQQGFNSNNQNNSSRISQSNSSTGYSSPSNTQSQNIFGNNNNGPSTSK
jgi:predicted molibdopterin-dependent oxidoreductase YjgC